MDALNIIHRLNDRRNLGTWTPGSTTVADIEFLVAHLAPRNAAHHREVPVTALTGESPPRTGTRPADRLVWDADVAGNRSPAGKLEYPRLLHRRSVVWSLSELYRIAFGVPPS